MDCVCNTYMRFHRYTNFRTGIRIGGTFVAGDAFFETPRVCNGMRTTVCDDDNGFDTCHLLQNQSMLDMDGVFLHIRQCLVYRIDCMYFSS